MATQRKRRRGTTAQHAVFTGAAAEITIDTDKKSVVVHDGVTPGGVAHLDRSNHIGFCTGDIASRRIPAPVMSFSTDGYSESGDGGGAQWRRIETPDPIQAWHRQSPDGAYWELNEPVVYIEMLGAIADEITGAEIAIENAFLASQALGVECRAGPGVFLCENSVSWSVTGDFRFVASPDTVFKASAGMPVDNKLFLPIVSAEASFEWRGGMIDGSLMPPRVSGAPDLLYIAGANFKRVRIDSVYFYVNEDRTGTAGDSCLFLAEGEDYWVENCIFQGAVDAGLYISGNSSGTSGRRAIVRGNIFLECGVAVVSKRGFEEHIISENFVRYCTAGIVVGDQGEAGLLPGRKAIIANNSMKFTGVAVELRISDDSIVIGNRCENFGVSASGVPYAASAIVLAGSKRCIVSGNVLAVPDITPHAASRGVICLSRTYNSTAYHSTSNLISGNVISGLNQGIREEDANNNGNSFADNLFTGVTTRYSNVAPPSRIDGAIFGSRALDPASVPAGGSASVTTTITGAVLGDYVESSFSLSLAGLTLSGYVSAADTVTSVFTNNTGGAIDLASGTLNLRVRGRAG